MSAMKCRACAGQFLTPILDLGLMPPSRRFLTPELAALPEPIYPLRVLRCVGCGLLQLPTGAGEDTTPPPAIVREATRLLAQSATAVLEIPDLVALHERLDCDLICDETRCYSSIAQLRSLFANHGLELIDVSQSDGRLSVTVQRRGGGRGVQPSVAEALARERAAELEEPETWADFAQLVEQGRDLLVSELQELQFRSARVAAYTRGGRGMTTLATCGAAALRLRCLIDEDPKLHGMMTPGHRLEIVGTERLEQEHFEAVLLLGLPWDPCADSPLHQYWRNGGRVLIPTPKPHFADAPKPVLLHSAPSPAFADFG